ncbi:MAG TPA: prepilin-type N-terminal cleavage/methylation domain-containing protein [Thermoanaerobaculia bacterium]|nr:prepilin-type N-terminal cleavage/methylation domain-containing protein [Thermoanaerobaculia bacterium]
MRIRNRRGQRGFTLIELLIVVAIIGIIAAILIPNLLDALQKAKQKSTVGDIRNIGTAWMSWVTDQMSAAAAGQSIFNWDTDLASNVSHSQLVELLEQPGDPNFFYLQELPEKDGWGNSLDFRANFDAADENSFSQLLQSARAIGICSPGRDGNDGSTDPCSGEYTPGTFIGTDYDQDIVWSDGYFVRTPGGVNAN